MQRLHVRVTIFQTNSGYGRLTVVPPNHPQNQPLAGPQRMLCRRPDAPPGPFSVHSRLAKDGDLEDITDEEIDALARLFLDCINEWNAQSHISGFPTNAK